MTRLMRQLGDLAGSDMVLARVGTLDRSTDVTRDDAPPRAVDVAPASGAARSMHVVARRIGRVFTRPERRSR